MGQIQNKQGISRITFPEIITHNFCPMGDDWYSNHITIVFEPKDIIPDYVDVDKAIKALNGKHLIIEDVVDKVYEEMLKYQPRYLKVSSSASDAVHSSVVVEKETR